MAKSISRSEYPIFCALLREIRERAGVTQVDMAAHLEMPQPNISNVEHGHMRLDFLQIRDWCERCGTSIAKFALLFERRLRRGRGSQAQ